MGMDTQRRLSLTLGISLLILAAELVGGLISNSLALLSDAGHVFTDSFALGLSLIAALISRRPTDQRATFGYHRVGLLAAVINGVSLVGIAAFIFFEAYRRFLSPPVIDLSLMLPVAAAGLAANVLMAAILGRGHGDLNIKSAWLHIIGDTLASVGVIVSGVIIYFTGWVYADPVASVLIGGIIIFGGIRVAKEALLIFLDLVPSGYDVEKIAGELLEVPGVQGVHDVHIRGLTHGRVEFTAHVRVLDQNISEADEIRSAVQERLRRMGISHTVLQVECVECTEEGLYCRICGDGAPVATHSHGER
jgi:cobalt-zinc-cadmium efflux system protein